MASDLLLRCELVCSYVREFCLHVYMQHKRPEDGRYTGVGVTEGCWSSRRAANVLKLLSYLSSLKYNFFCLLLSISIVDKIGMFCASNEISVILLKIC